MVASLIRGFNSFFNSGAELDVVYRASKVKEKIDSSRKAHRYFRRIWDKELLTEQEQVYVIFVDHKCRPISSKCIHTGGVSEVRIDIQVIMRYIVKFKAAGIFIGHNHPLGGVKAGEEDVETTNKLATWCDMTNIKFYDHIIITKKSYFSFKENGLID